ncbi:MAG: Spy/CpxP family protein refolding chaperone [Alphaproteobacteria bacterium]|nr:Spy/CpxP family protein refolding chaperone [Alphaproteobacteria bacterium]
MFKNTYSDNFGLKTWRHRLIRRPYAMMLAMAFIAVVAAGCMGQGDKMDARHLDKMAAKIKDHMTEVKGKLNLAPEQIPLWAQFEQTAHAQIMATKSDMLAHFQTMKAAHEAEEAAKANTSEAKLNPPNVIERMTWHQQMMESNANRLKLVIAAATPLYNSLSLTQKQIVDEEMKRFHKGGRHHRFW